MRFTIRVNENMQEEVTALINKGVYQYKSDLFRDALEVFLSRLRLQEEFIDRGIIKNLHESNPLSIPEIIFNIDELQKEIKGLRALMGINLGYSVVLKRVADLRDRMDSFIRISKELSIPTEIIDKMIVVISQHDLSEPSFYKVEMALNNIIEYYHFSNLNKMPRSDIDTWRETVQSAKWRQEIYLALSGLASVFRSITYLLGEHYQFTGFREDYTK